MYPNSQLTLHPPRIMRFVVLIFITCWAFSQPTAHAQPVPPHLPPGQDPDFTPPGQTNNLDDLSPPGMAIANYHAQQGQPFTTPILSPNQGRAMRFDNARVSAIVEANTFDTPAHLQFTPIATNTLSLLIDEQTGETQFKGETPDHLIHFQMEAVENNGNIIPHFQKRIRMALDLRQLYDTPPSGGTYFLAYQDEADPSLWHEVDITTHDEAGLISAEVSHFSDWVSGWRPDGWSLHWDPPSADGFSGSAGFSHSFQLPPGRNGLQPSLSLSYSSSALNMALRNVTAGTVGTGWSLNEIAVVRTGVEVGTTNITFTDKFRLVLNGAGHKLIDGGQTLLGGDLYYAKDAPSLRVLKYTDYWVVQSDGVLYRLGYTTESRTTRTFELNSGGNEQSGIIEWHVDTVTDNFGNQIVYDRNNSVRTDNTHTSFFCPWGGICWSDTETYASRVIDIHYNFANRATGVTNNTPPTNNTPRLTSGSATKVHFTYNGAGRLNKITIYHNSTNPIREYEISTSSSQITNECRVAEESFLNTTTHLVNAIQEFGWDGDTQTRYSLPAITFDYEKRHNHNDYWHWELEGTIHTEGPDKCFEYQFLKRVHNGYGGETEFVYNDDGRDPGEWDYEYTGSAVISWPSYAMSHFVTDLYHDDGKNVGRIQFQRSDSCYNQTTSIWGTNCPQDDDPPEFGGLAGFGEVTTIYYDYDNTILSATKTNYHQEANKFGRPYNEEMGTYNGGVLTWFTKKETSYTPLSFGNGVQFTVLASEVNRIRRWDSGQPLEVTSKTTYEYNEGHQGGIQYGNLTHTRQYQSANPNEPPSLTTARWFAPNASNSSWYWFVSQSIGENLYDGDFGQNLLTVQHNFYDNHTGLWTPPTQGKVTRTTVGEPIPCNDVTGYSGACDVAVRTVESETAYDVYGNATQMSSYTDYGQVVSVGSNIVHHNAPSEVRHTSITYEPSFNLYPTEATNPVGQKTKFYIYGFNASLIDTFQQQTGLLQRVENPDGTKMVYEYDPFGRLFNVYEGYGTANINGANDTDPWNGDVLTRYRYWDTNWHTTPHLDPANNDPFLISVHTLPNTYTPASGYALREVAYYDGLGRPIQSQNRWSEVSGVSGRQDLVTTTAYNGIGQTVCTTTPFRKSHVDLPNGFDITACANKPHTATIYDISGKPTLVTEPSGATVDYNYFHVSEYSIDGDSELYFEQTKDQNSHVVNRVFNSEGQMLRVLEYTGNSSVTYQEYANTDYEYDVMGNLTKVTDDVGNVTTISYDNFGHKVSMNDPDMGEWGYEYDAVGNLTRQEDNLNSGNPQVICFYYDEMGRLLHKAKDSTPANSCPTTPPTSGNTHLASYTYNNTSTATGSAGKITQVRWGSNPSSNKETFTYDSWGRAYQHKRWIDNISFAMTTNSFDLLHRPLSVTYPDGDVVSYNYDREGGNKLTLDSKALVTNVTYNERGQMVLFDRKYNVNTRFYYYNATGSNGDDNYRLKEIRHGSNNDLNFPDFVYHYNPAGNIYQIETKKSTQSETNLYQYDELNRLTDFSKQVGAGYTLLRDYGYDTIGNLTKIGNTTLQYPAGGEDQPHGVDTGQNGSTSYDFDYDERGNMVDRTDNTGSYDQAFDVQNRLTGVTKSGQTTSFWYDATGIRVKTLQPDGTIIYYPFPQYEEEHRCIPSSPTVNQTSPANGASITENTIGVTLSGNSTFNSCNETRQLTVYTRDVTSGGSFAPVCTFNPTTDTYNFTCVRPDKFLTSNHTYEWYVVSQNESESTTSSTRTFSYVSCGYGGCGEESYVPPSQSIKPVLHGKPPERGTQSATVAVIKRSTFSLAGMTVVVKVTGDPESENNGTFHLYTDHLGSTVVMGYALNDNGSVHTPYNQVVSGTFTKYYPFGEYRQAPTTQLTDRGYTGHIHDNTSSNDVGLIYMNARFYIPGVARFASADTIVPDPINPQQFNKYTYVLNSPLGYTDPTGHFCYDAESNEFSDGDCYDHEQQTLVDYLVLMLESGATDLEISERLLNASLRLISNPIAALRAVTEIVRRESGDLTEHYGWAFTESQFFYESYTNERFDDSGFGDLTDPVHANQVSHFIGISYISAYTWREAEIAYANNDFYLPLVSMYHEVQMSILIYGNELVPTLQGGQSATKTLIEVDLGRIAMELGRDLVVNHVSLSPYRTSQEVTTAINSITSYSFCDQHPTQCPD